jgi:hypothetical protein
MRLLLLLLVTAGCPVAGGPPGDETPVDLSYYPEVNVRASAVSTQIILGRNVRETLYAPCPAPAGPITVRLGEARATVLSPGGKLGETAGDDVADNECGPPIYEVDGPPPVGAARLDLADATSSLSCLLPDLQAARAATAASWEWHFGQPVTVTWTPAGDLARGTYFQVTIQRLDLQGTVVATYAVGDVTTSAELVRFTVPEIAPAPVGPFRVDFQLTPTVLCAPYDKPAYIQSTAARFSFSRPVTILP